VTTCDEGGKGVKNRPKKRDVLYGRPVTLKLSILSARYLSIPEILFRKGGLSSEGGGSNL